MTTRTTFTLGLGLGLLLSSLVPLNLGISQTFESFVGQIAGSGYGYNAQADAQLGRLQHQEQSYDLNSRIGGQFAAPSYSQRPCY